MTLSLQGERLELCDPFACDLRAGLEAAGLSVVGTNLPRLTATDVALAARECVAAGVPTIVYGIATWADPSAVVPVIQDCGVPAIVIANGEPSSFGFTGASIIHGALDRLGIIHRIQLGGASDPGWDDVIAFIRAAGVAARIRAARYGLIGGQSPGQYTGSVETLELRQVFGLELEQVDELIVVDRARVVPEEHARSVLVHVQQSYGGFDADGEAALRAARLRIALEEIIGERGWDLVSVKCLADTINSYVSFCLAASLLNTSERTISCQGDIPATIMMEVLRLLSGEPAFFGDLVSLDVRAGRGRLVNCGAAPVALAADRRSVQWMPQYEYMGAGGGVTASFAAREGRVTVAALTRTAAGFRMMIASADAAEEPRSVFAQVREAWPHAFTHFNGDASAIVRELRSNHVVLGYGDHVAALTALADLWGIQSVVI